MWYIRSLSLRRLCHQSHFSEAAKPLCHHRTWKNLCSLGKPWLSIHSQLWPWRALLSTQIWHLSPKQCIRLNQTIPLWHWWTILIFKNKLITYHSCVSNDGTCGKKSKLAHPIVKKNISVQDNIFFSHLTVVEDDQVSKCSLCSSISSIYVVPCVFYFMLGRQ